MQEIFKEYLFKGGTYLVTILGLWVNIDNIKGLVLFIGSVTLLVLQIRLHLIKLRNEKANKK